MALLATGYTVGLASVVRARARVRAMEASTVATSSFGSAVLSHVIGVLLAVVAPLGLSITKKELTVEELTITKEAFIAEEVGLARL